MNTCIWSLFFKLHQGIPVDRRGQISSITAITGKRNVIPLRVPGDFTVIYHNFILFIIITN